MVTVVHVSGNYYLSFLYLYWKHCYMYHQNAHLNLHLLHHQSLQGFSLMKFLMKFVMSTQARTNIIIGYEPFIFLALTMAREF